MLPRVARGIAGRTEPRDGDGEQLRLPLAWTPSWRQDSLAASFATVLDSWRADPAIGAPMIERFTAILARFVRFAAAHQVTTLAAVDHALTATFVAASQRNRDGAVTRPSVTTMRARRTALRAFFRTALNLRLTLDDPVTGLDRPNTAPRGATVPARPLTAEEAALVRLYARRATPTRHAATIAVLLAGAHTSEAGHVTTADLDPAASTARLAGTARYQPRTLPLDPWARRVLADRADHLTQHRLMVAEAPGLCAAAGGTPASRQAAVCVTVHEILTRAGLSTEPGVRPSSLTGHAGREVFDRTGRVEDAARLLGSRSLDATAVLIGHDWQAHR